MNTRLMTGLTAVVTTVFIAVAGLQYQGVSGATLLALAGGLSPIPPAAAAPAGQSEQQAVPDAPSAPANEPPGDLDYGDKRGYGPRDPWYDRDRGHRYKHEHYGLRERDPWYDIQRMQDEMERSFLRMQEEMDRIMDEAYGRFGLDPYYGPRPGPRPLHDRGTGFGPRHALRPPISGSPAGFISPDMDIQDAGDAYVVLVNVPGSDENNITVQLEDNRLSVSAAQVIDRKESDSHGNLIYRERRSGSFRRSITLPGAVKDSGMKTEYHNGVLRITIPKA